MGIFPSNITPLLSILLPKSLNQEIKETSGIEEALHIGHSATSLAIAALDHLQQGNLRQMDALVGETSCQLRALKVASYFAELSASSEKQRQLKSTIEKIKLLEKAFVEILREPLPQNGDGLKVVPFLESVLIKKGIELDLKLSDDESFVILSHLLYKTRDKEKPSLTNHNQILEFLPKGRSISEYALNAIAFKAKEELAKRSVGFIQKQASSLKTLPARTKKIFETALNQKNVQYVASTLPCTPCYFNIRVLLEKLQESDLNLVLKVKRFDANGVPLDEEPLQIVSKSASKSALVFEGVSISEENQKLSRNDYVEGLLKTGLKEIILLNAASHPQYAGRKKDAPLPLFSKKDSTGNFSLERELTSRLRPQGEDQKESPLLAFENRKQERILRSLCPGNDFETVLTVYKEFVERQKKAEKEGFCQKNPKRFQLKHIYAGTLEKEVKNDAP